MAATVSMYIFDQRRRLYSMELKELQKLEKNLVHVENADGKVEKTALKIVLERERLLTNNYLLDLGSADPHIAELIGTKASDD